MPPPRAGLGWAVKRVGPIYAKGLSSVRISVITPTFNRASTLPRALESVLAQSFAPVEHLIMDNRSSDATSSVVADYARRAPYPVIHLCEQDTGMYDALNRGIARATGDAIYILNDDDAIADAGVFRFLSACMEQTAADVVYGDIFWLNQESRKQTLRRNNQINKLTLVHKGINQQAILHRTTVYQRCGVYDQGYRIAGDYEWLLRAFLKNDISATYLRHPVAVCSLGGLSNAEQWRQRASEERQRAIQTWYSEREIARARAYRKFYRKLPLGTLLFQLFQPLTLRIRTVRVSGGSFVPDLAAALGY